MTSAQAHTAARLMDAATIAGQVARANRLADIAEAAEILADRTAKAPDRMGNILGAMFVRDTAAAGRRLADAIAAAIEGHRVQDEVETAHAELALRRAANAYATKMMGAR